MDTFPRPQATAAIGADDEPALEQRLTEMWEIVSTAGAPMPADDLSPSDAIVPPYDLSLKEARRLIGDEGLIPDPPSR